MKCTPFRAALLVTGIFSLGFQICAIIVPAWYRFRLPVKFGYSTLDIDYDLGFWMAIVCFDDGVSRDDVCEFKNIQQMSNNITIGSQNSKCHATTQHVVQFLAGFGSEESG